MRRKWVRLTSHVSLLTGLTACAVTPLSNRIRVGEEPFVIGVGEGSDAMTDLFAAPAGGGAFAVASYLVDTVRKASAASRKR